MQNLIDFPGQNAASTLEDFVNWRTNVIHSQLGRDSPAAEQEIERMHIGITFAIDFSGDTKISPSGIARLNSHAVAQHVAPGLSAKDRIGVDRILADLVRDARMFLDKARPTPATGTTELCQEVEDILKRMIARLPLPHEMSYVVSGAIKVDLHVACASDETKTAA